MTYVGESLPSKGRLFYSLVKSAFYPFSLGTELDVIDAFSHGQAVEKLKF